MGAPWRHGIQASYRNPDNKTFHGDKQLNAPAIPIRSAFVTVLAWIFIILAGFSTLIGILQNIMIQVMFSAPDMQAAMETSRQTGDVPATAQFMFDNMRWFFLFALIVFATTFVSSIGLLKRKNWARIFFIAIMTLGIIWNIGGFVFQLLMFSTIPDMPPNASPDMHTQFNTISIIFTVVGGIMALAFSVLFGWIIKRLISPGIKQEFQAGQ